MEILLMKQLEEVFSFHANMPSHVRIGKDWDNFLGDYWTWWWFFRMNLKNACRVWIQLLFPRREKGWLISRGLFPSKQVGSSVILWSLTESSYLGNIWFSWEQRHFFVLQCPLLYHISMTLPIATANTICFSKKHCISPQEWLPNTLAIGKPFLNHEHWY